MKTSLHCRHPRSSSTHRRPASFVLKALPAALVLGFSQTGWATDPPPPTINVGAPNGLPVNGTVRAGDGASGAVVDNQLTITQTTQRAVIDWTAFNIDAGKTVRFEQPAAGAVLNRVNGATNASQISGSLSANGMVMLMNPHGVLFNQGSSVNVGALIATTGTINENTFTHTSAQITGALGGSIINEGNIAANAGSSGLVALVAPSVINRHVISATGGTIGLLGSTATTISLNNGLYEFAIPGGATGTAVTNASGASLNAANIHLGVGDAANLLSGVINLEGVQQASSAIVVNGDTVVLRSALGAPSVSGNSYTVNVSGAARIQDGVNIARFGGAVNIAAGIYVQPGTLKISKSLTLSGAGEGTTIVDARGVTDYGIQVSGNNVTLKNFTLYGPSANVASSYGIKVAPSGGTAARLHDFAISKVTIRGSGRAELDLNGVVGAVIDLVTADGAPVGNDTGTTAGAGIQITDSANVTVSNSTTRNNQWGGLALYQANIHYDQRVNNITISGNNTFNEFNPVYLQDQSASLDFGTLNIEGFDHAVRNNASTDSRQYTWLQASQQKAFDFAVNVPVSPESSYVQGWTGGAVMTQNFKVGTGRLLAGGDKAMSIGAAIGAAATGAAVDVYAGTYAEQLALNKTGLTLTGHAGAKLVVPDATEVNGISITANNVTVTGMEIAGPATSAYLHYAWGNNISRGIAVGNGVTGFNINNNNIHDVRNGILIHGNNTGNVTGNRVDNTKSAVSVQYTDGSGITIADNTQGTHGNEWGLNLHLNGHMVGSNIISNSTPISADPTLEWQQSLRTLSTANAGWSVQDQAYTSSNRTHVNVATGGSSSAQGSALNPLNTVQGGINAVVSGGTVNVGVGTFSENVNITKALTLDGAGVGQTILKAPLAASGDAVAIRASGVTLSDLSINDSFYGVHLRGTAHNATINRVAFNNNRYSVRSAGDSRADNFRMLNSTISGGLIGFQSYNNYGAGAGNASFKNALFENVTVSDTSFKGFYFETADNLTMRNVTISNAGNVGDPDTLKFGAAIDVNLKYDAFNSLTFDNVAVKNSGHSSGNDTRAAVVIKTRGIPGDTAYAAAPASLQSVNIMGGSIEGSTGTGVRFETLSNGSGGQPSVTISGGTQFKNNGTDIVVDRTNVDAREAVFVGAAGDGFAIEDRVTHALDATGRGLVTWEAGNVYVTHKSGSIQRGVDAAGIGDTVNVANASFAENVAVNTRRNLAFNDTRLQSLTLNSGAAGSGISGAVTAEGAGGFLFDANVNLLTDTTLTTLGADINFKQDIQNAGNVARGLRLIAGSGGLRGNVYLATGGTAGQRLGQFDVIANQFNLASTLWVRAYAIDALGDVALSNSTLNTEAASRLYAGGNVTGATRGLSTVDVTSDKDMNAAISGTDVIARAKGAMQLVVDATNSVSMAAETIQANVNAPVVMAAAVQEVQISGSSQNLTIDAPKGSVSGSFGQVSNTGSGLVNVNGKPQGNQALTSNADNSRVLPAGEVRQDEGEAGVQLALAQGLSASGEERVSRRTPEAAGEAIDNGESVELDLSPRQSREDKEKKEQK